MPDAAPYHPAVVLDNIWYQPGHNRVKCEQVTQLCNAEGLPQPQRNSRQSAPASQERSQHVLTLENLPRGIPSGANAGLYPPRDICVFHPARPAADVMPKDSNKHKRLFLKSQRLLVNQTASPDYPCPVARIECRMVSL